MWIHAIGIVMTFWYVFWNGLNFFELFKLYFHLGLITTPHVLYDHMTYVYSFSHASFFTRSHGQEKSLSYYDLLYDFRSFTLWTHPHPHSLPLLHTSGPSHTLLQVRPYYEDLDGEYRGGVVEEEQANEGEDASVE